MALDLNKLTAINGFIAGGEFTDGGELVGKVGEMDDNIGAIVADMCSANMRMANMQAHGFTKFSKMKGFEKANGFAISAASLSLCVFGNASVFVRNSDCDFNEVFAALRSLS